jgi:hypothetical protein
MQTYGLEAYRARELTIEMRTSSGDLVNIGLSSEQSVAAGSQESPQGRSASFVFSSLQRFSFSVETNGISEQDEKEIAAFMEIARPYIDDFMSELQSGRQTTPRNEVAREVAAVFDPLKGNGNAVENHAKHAIVSLFDDAVRKVEDFETLLEEAQKLLEKTLDDFDREGRLLYA